MIYTSKEINEDTNVGVKAKRLRELEAFGYAVPPFVVLDGEATEVFLGDDQVHKEKLAATATETIPADAYAVRSAAFIEDDTKNSQAGQFMTRLCVMPEDLATAVKDVALDAENKLGSQSAFSIIIEKFVEPEYAGVLFTRDPRGGREMALEYREGRGELVVSGEAVISKSFLFERVEEAQVPFSELSELASIGRSLEEQYGHPQDIEWAVAGGTLYILQTRPITSIAPGEFAGLHAADAFLAEHGPCLLEQTAVSETFSHPTPLAFSILETLYGKHGPIERAYRSVGISFQANNQLVQVRGSVYIDKEAEIRSLLPSLGYIAHEGVVPKLVRFTSLLTTLRNWWRLHALPIKNTKRFHAAINEILTRPLPAEVGLKERWATLVDQYEHIFLINLFSQKALSALSIVLGKDSEKALGLVSEIEHEEYACDLLKSAGLFDRPVGNSISLDDTSMFTASACFSEDKKVAEIQQWWQQLPNWKRQGLTPKVARAKQYMVLREEGRWCSVRLVHYLREEVTRLGAETYPEDVGLINFHTIEELMSGALNKEVALQRRSEYQANSAVVMPQRIAGYVVPDGTIQNQGISAGGATGVLVSKEEYEKTDGPKILYTEVLSPDLAELLSGINGIVARKGGALSHLAIIAREAGVPVVVSSDPLELGSRVSVNGSTGEVKLL